MIDFERSLIRLLATRSTKRGTFTLASGRTSSFYIDARLTTMTPEGLSIIGPYALAAVRSRWSIQSVGGLTLGADPVSYAIAYASAHSTQPLRAFTVRKEAKTHGTGQLIEGPFQPGDHVAITEDVITSGQSALRAITAVEQAGGIVKGVLAVVDREEGGKRVLEQAGYQVISLATATQILSFIDASP